MNYINFKRVTSCLLSLLVSATVVASDLTSVGVEDSENYLQADATTLSNEEIIFNFLTGELKLNIAAACGVLANIEKESNFNNDITEYGYTWATGAGYGICQWTNSPRTASEGRRTNLVNYCNSNGYDYKSLMGQLYFLKYELETTYYSSVYQPLLAVSNTSDGAYEAGKKWCYSFEVPANRETESVNRGNTASTTYWEKYKNYYSMMLSSGNNIGSISYNDRDYSTLSTETVTTTEPVVTTVATTKATTVTTKATTKATTVTTKATTTTTAPVTTTVATTTTAPVTTTVATVTDICKCSKRYAGQYLAHDATVAIRSLHSMDSSIVAMVAPNTEVTVTMGDGTWAHVKYGKYEGYALMEDLFLKPLYGDVNVDGNIDNLDVLTLKKYLFNRVKFSEERLERADITHDGTINVEDLLALKNMIITGDSNSNN